LEFSVKYHQERRSYWFTAWPALSNRLQWIERLTLDDYFLNGFLKIRAFARCLFSVKISFSDALNAKSNGWKSCQIHNQSINPWQHQWSDCLRRFDWRLSCDHSLIRFCLPIWYLWSNQWWNQQGIGNGIK
jgi:hypothetical protein